jgi:hypothetical protein
LILREIEVEKICHSGFETLDFGLIFARGMVHSRFGKGELEFKWLEGVYRPDQSIWRSIERRLVQGFRKRDYLTLRDYSRPQSSSLCLCYLGHLR